MVSDGGKAQARAERDIGLAEWSDPDPPATRCKHRPGDCERCGTTDRRDALHETIGGRGVVARIGRRR